MPSPIFRFNGTQDSGERRNYDTTTIKFGGRYEQRLRNVPQTQMRSWDMTFNLRASQVSEAVEFLDGRGGVASFLFPDPRTGVLRDVVCEEWAVRPIRGTTRHLLQARFREVPPV